MKNYIFIIEFLLVCCLIILVFMIDKNTDYSLFSNKELEIWEDSVFDESKENLILVHSFPTNTVLLEGLGEYLKDYFNLYFIDLPGFNPEISPLKEISFDYYRKYTSDKINGLNLENYWIGGISFGFLIVNEIGGTDNCLGIFALEPFLGIKDTKVSPINVFFLKMVSDLVNLTNTQEWLWRSDIFKYFLSKGNTADRIDLMLKTVDPKTFFKTGDLILNHEEEIKFQNKPYILMINKNDKTILTSDVVETFKSKIKDLLIVETEVEHYPKTISVEYFEKTIGKDDIESVYNFIDKIKKNY